MPIDFPNSPTNGQTFTAGSITWTWNGSTWELLSYGAQGYQGFQGPQGVQGRLVTSDTAPASPVTGDMWFDSSTGNSYTYYDGFWIAWNQGAQGAQGVQGASGVNPSAEDDQLVLAFQIFS